MSKSLSTSSKSETTAGFSNRNGCGNYEYWTSGGCGSTSIGLDIKTDNTFEMKVYNCWMGGDKKNIDMILTGRTKLIKVPMISKKTKDVVGKRKYVKLIVDEIVGKVLSIEPEIKYNYKRSDCKVDIKVVLMKNPRLTKLESGEEEWFGWGGSWNKIRDAFIIVPRKTLVNCKNIDPIKNLCRCIKGCELTLCKTNDSIVSRKFFKLTYRSDLDKVKNYSDHASIYVVFDRAYAVTNSVIELLFKSLLKEEKIPDTLYIDGSGKCSIKPFDNQENKPEGFPAAPIATMSTSAANDFTRAQYSTPYHLMQVIKINPGSEELNDDKKYMKKFVRATKRLRILMNDEEGKRVTLNDRIDKKKRMNGLDDEYVNNEYVNNEYVNNEYVNNEYSESEDEDAEVDNKDGKKENEYEYIFLSCVNKSYMEYHDMYRTSSRLICQIPGEDGIVSIDFGKVSYEMLKNKKGGLVTMLSSALRIE
jgi:hypothetical protein